MTDCWTHSSCLWVSAFYSWVELQHFPRWTPALPTFHRQQFPMCPQFKHCFKWAMSSYLVLLLNGLKQACWMFIITAGVAEYVCILSIWPCEFNKEMKTSLHLQARGIINTNQQKDQQQDYPGLLASRNGTRCNPETDCRREGRKGYFFRSVGNFTASPLSIASNSDLCICAWYWA